MRVKDRFRDVKEVDRQILWQKKVIREEAKERKVGRRWT
jgi:hypothetical protein